MSELQRLKDGDDLAASLLRSAGDDAPSPAARRAIAAGLAPSLGALKGATAKAGLAKMTALKVTSAMLLVGTAVGVHRVVTRRDESEVTVAATPEPAVRVPDPQPATPPPPPPSVSRVPSPAPRLPPPVLRPPAPVARRPAPGAVAVAIAESPPPSAEAVAPEVAPEPPPPPPAQPAPQHSTLSAELAQLDQALAALRRQDARSALIALDAYDQQFPHGELAPESLAARVEATVLARDLPRARALAARFVAAYPHSPATRHVKDLVGAP